MRHRLFPSIESQGRGDTGDLLAVKNPEHGILTLGIRISQEAPATTLSSLCYCPSRMESSIRSFRKMPTVPLSAN